MPCCSCCVSDKSSKLNKRFDYTRYWQVPLCKTCCADCCYCNYAMCCCYCASFGLRKQALYGDMSRYICCNGDCPCSGHCCEDSCPHCCLCLETWCCFGQSVASTRFMIMDELLLETTCCDTCIIGTMIVLQWVACICQCIACITGNADIQLAADCLTLCADIAWCTVCACMQTQHKIELDYRDKHPEHVPQQQQLMAPPQQIIIITNQPPPGYAPLPGGYPPQQYGQQQYGQQQQQQGWNQSQQPRGNQIAPNEQWGGKPNGNPVQQNAYR